MCSLNAKTSTEGGTNSESSPNKGRHTGTEETLHAVAANEDESARCTGN